MWLKVHRKDGNQFYNLDHVSIIERDPLFDKPGILGVKLIYPESERTVLVRVEDFARFETPATE